MEEEQLNELIRSLENYNIREQTKSTTHGIGLLNIYKRLKLFYRDQAEFTIQSKLQEGTIVAITVPVFRENFEQILILIDNFYAECKGGNHLVDKIVILYNQLVTFLYEYYPRRKISNEIEYYNYYQIVAINQLTTFLI